MIRSIIAGSLLLLSSTIWARDNGQYENVPPEIRSWFRTQKSPQGFLCCSIADGHYTAWRTSQTKGYEYDVPIDGKWYPVPPEVVIRTGDNPTGESIVWYVWYEDTLFIRCFILGSGA